MHRFEDLHAAPEVELLMKNNQKLELTWIGKEKRPKLEPRILIEDPDRSYGDRHTENMLIYGDNLLALKALEQDFSNRIKCIFIDPPYNTGSAFTHYEDGLEHSLWLTMMRDRLEILRRLLAEDGSIWITIDDNEAHYLKVLCDEVFGRGNFVANVIWQKKFSPQNDAKWLSDMHDHVIVHAKDKNLWHPNRIPLDSKASENRKNIDDDPRGEWVSVDYTCNKNRYERPNLFYEITNPFTSEAIWPKETAVWRFSEERHLQNVKNGFVYWGKNGKNHVPRFKNFKAILAEGQIPSTLWFHQDVGNNQEARKESLQFNRQDPFATPKPERLFKRVLEIATSPGDLVLDSFAGSGTTGAVAHKMGRRWIMVELGEHCHTHILPRMKKVCDGIDQGGISKAVNWRGGGGFKYYDMAPSLLKKDRYDQWVINAEYNAPMLAAAMAKHENFRYSPDEVHYWKQGQSSEKDFIFTTTVHLTPEHLDRINEEMKPGESLLICCKSHFDGADGKYDSITVKKIPSMLLGKCEFGRDDYSLNIVDMPRNGDEPEFVPTGPLATEAGKANKKAKAGHSDQMSIFEDMGE
jgi:adenine-specific DNA-methyltransferase